MGVNTPACPPGTAWRLRYLQRVGHAAAWHSIGMGMQVRALRLPVRPRWRPYGGPPESEGIVAG